jgi:uroporphyrinogen-III decarboxylase
MDLMREKAALLTCLDIPPDRVDTYHFTACPSPEEVAKVRARLAGSLYPPLQVHADSVAHVARQADLLPIGMSIGPFSLMTKLLADPIPPVYLAGTGLTADDDPEVQTVEVLLDLALQMVLRSVTAQLAAGAKAIFIAEPAANSVYISPRQLGREDDVFARYVLAPNRQIKARLDAAGADLIFHCCGELVDEMVQAFCRLRPVILTLGSSRRLWEDVRLVPDDIVLFGNLPSKHFYSADLPRPEVERLTCELLARMRATGHPFILGSECDILSVHGYEDTIREKVNAFVRCACP